MKLFNFKILRDETKDIEGIETWIVSWKRMTGQLCDYPDMKPCYQAFADFEKATEFKKMLEQAHKLIGNTINTEVLVEKQSVGL